MTTHATKKVTKPTHINKLPDLQKQLLTYVQEHPGCLLPEIVVLFKGTNKNRNMHQCVESLVKKELLVVKEDQVWWSGNETYIKYQRCKEDTASKVEMKFAPLAEAMREQEEWSRLQLERKEQRLQRIQQICV